MPTTPALALPYPPPTGVAPDVPYYMQQLAEAVELNLLPAAVPPHAILRGSVVQNVPNDVVTATVMGSNLSSSGCTVNLAAGSVTITTGNQGLYLITHTVGYVANATGFRYAVININGAEAAIVSTSGVASQFVINSVTTLQRLVASDVIVGATRQNSGAALATASAYTRQALNVLRVGD